MEFKIRKAIAEDLPAILLLVRELAEYEKEPEAVTATIEDYLADFEAGIFEAHVVELQGNIVGMALYYLSYSTWKGRMLYLEDFIVAKEYRRLGIGQKLFDEVIEEGRRMGARLLKWQVLDWNKPALNFYRRYNATIETDWWNGKIFL